MRAAISATHPLMSGMTVEFFHYVPQNVAGTISSSVGAAS